MNRTNIYLEDRQVVLLDRIAAQEGVSRAQVIRRLLDRALSGRDTDRDADLDAIDRSFGAVPDMEAAERGVDDRADHLALVWGRA